METLDLALKRGDSNQFSVIVYDADDAAMDLTGYSYTAQIRRTADSVTVVGTFTVDSADEATGELRLSLPVAVSETLDTTLPLGGVWDLQISRPEATPIITTTHGGDVTVTEDVSRV